MIRGILPILLLWLAASPTMAVECQSTDYSGTRYSFCTVDPTRENLRLFLRDADGVVYGHFTNIDTALAANGQHLIFAMNAGMYHEDRAPVGLYLEDGKEQMHLVPGSGPGNFGLVPNGVFCLRDGRADVIETSQYLKNDPNCRDASQSGPMLVINGALHPRFLSDGTSKYIRNGVGTTRDGRRVVFVVSDMPVNFYDFGLFFRDFLKLPNALYFDGNISRIYAPQLGRNDIGFRLGPIVGVVEDAQ